MVIDAIAPRIAVAAIATITIATTTSMSVTPHWHVADVFTSVMVGLTHLHVAGGCVDRDRVGAEDNSHYGGCFKFAAAAEDEHSGWACGDAVRGAAAHGLTIDSDDG